MKISSRGRYALASMVVLAERHGRIDPVAVITVSEALCVSKIYLEQVFSLLKKSGLVLSSKGSRGGYRLASNPGEITVYDILKAAELGLFEKGKDNVMGECAAHYERAIQDLVRKRVDEALEKVLKEISLEDILGESVKNKDGDGYMFFI